MDKSDGVNRKDPTRDPEKIPSTDPENESSEQFGSPLEYWLSVIGYAVGFGNVWRFPYLLYENGGGAFLIPYSISLFLICMPLFLLETAYGQLTRRKVHKFFSTISPGLKGFTYAQLFMGVMSNVFYVVLLMWSVWFLFNSFTTPLPWEATEADLKKGIFWNEHYFKHELLQSSESINDLGSLVLQCVLALVVSWLLVYLCIFKGIESSGKIVYITAPLPYILLVVLLIRGMTLEGAFGGWYYLFVPDFSKVFKLKVWRDAINQIIYSSSLGGATLIMYSSYRKKSEKVMRSSIVVPLVNSATSILSSLVLFSFLGHMAYKFDMEIDEIPIEGLELAFVAYPALLTQLPGSNFWAVLFFIMLVTVGIDSLFGNVDTVITIIYGMIKKYDWVPGRPWVTIWYCLLCFFASLIFATSAGIHIFELFNHFAIGINLIFYLFFQTIVIGWLYGFKNLEELAKELTNEKIPRIYSIFIKYIIPILLFVLWWVSFAQDVTNDFGFPGWALFVGWVFTIFPSAIMIIVFLYRYFKPKTSSSENSKEDKSAKKMKKSNKREEPPKEKEEYRI